MPHFWYFTFNLGKFYNYNTLKFTLETFHKVVDILNIYFSYFLSHLYNCLGGWAIFIFLQSFFLFFSSFSAELLRKKFWAWTETKTGLSWGRITAKASDKLQTCCIFNMFTCSNSISSFESAIGIMWLILNIRTCWRSKMFETPQMCKVFQRCENILNPSPD